MILYRCTRRFANLAAFFAVFAMMVAPAEAAFSACCCDVAPTNSCCVGEASPETVAKKACCCVSKPSCESSFSAEMATDGHDECCWDNSCSCDGCDCVLAAGSALTATVEASSAFALHGSSQLASVMLEYPVFRVDAFVSPVESLTSCDRCARLCRWLN